MIDRHKVGYLLLFVIMKSPWKIQLSWARHLRLCLLASTKYFSLSNMYLDMQDRYKMCAWSVSRDTYWVLDPLFHHNAGGEGSLALPAQVGGDKK